MRIFIALTFDEDFLNRLAKEIKDIKKKIKGKWIEKEKWHLTLAFLGEKSEEQIKDVKNFLLNLDLRVRLLKTFKIDYSLPFKNKVRMVWVHFKYDNFEAFQEIFNEFKVDRFYPHINLIRFKPRSLKNLPIIKKDFLVEVKPLKLVLFKSILKKEGAFYEPLFWRLL